MVARVLWGCVGPVNRWYKAAATVSKTAKIQMKVFFVCMIGLLMVLMSLLSIHERIEDYSFLVSQSLFFDK